MCDPYMRLYEGSRAARPLKCLSLSIQVAYKSPKDRLATGDLCGAARAVQRFRPCRVASHQTRRTLIEKETVHRSRTLCWSPYVPLPGAARTAAKPIMGSQPSRYFSFYCRSQGSGPLHHLPSSAHHCQSARHTTEIGSFIQARGGVELESAECPIQKMGLNDPKRGFDAQDAFDWRSRSA